MVSLVNGVKKRNQMSAENVFHGKMDILSMVVKIDFFNSEFRLSETALFLVRALQESIIVKNNDDLTVPFSLGTNCLFLRKKLIFLRNVL